MAKILIFGNSGSGKSTLARRLRETHGLAHLDLDPLAWKPTSPPERKPIEESDQEIQAFTASNETWVIEGCYTDLLKLVEVHVPAHSDHPFRFNPISDFGLIRSLISALSDQK